MHEIFDIIFHVSPNVPPSSSLMLHLLPCRPPTLTFIAQCWNMATWAPWFLVNDNFIHIDSTSYTKDASIRMATSFLPCFTQNVCLNVHWTSNITIARNWKNTHTQMHCGDVRQKLKQIRRRPQTYRKVVRITLWSQNLCDCFNSKNQFYIVAFRLKPETEETLLCPHHYIQTHCWKFRNQYNELITF